MAIVLLMPSISVYHMFTIHSCVAISHFGFDTAFLFMYMTASVLGQCLHFKFHCMLKLEITVCVL